MSACTRGCTAVLCGKAQLYDVVILKHAFQNIWTYIPFSLMFMYDLCGFCFFVTVPSACFCVSDRLCFKQLCKTGKIWAERKRVWLNTLRGIKAVKSVYCRVFALVVSKESLTRRKKIFSWKLVEYVHIKMPWDHTNVHSLLVKSFWKKDLLYLKKHNNLNYFFPRLCNLNIAIHAWRCKRKTFIDWNTLLYQHIKKEFTKRYKPSNSSVQ